MLDAENSGSAIIDEATRKEDERISNENGKIAVVNGNSQEGGYIGQSVGRNGRGVGLKPFGTESRILRRRTLH